MAVNLAKTRRKATNIADFAVAKEKYRFRHIFADSCNLFLKITDMHGKNRDILVSLLLDICKNLGSHSQKADSKV